MLRIDDKSKCCGCQACEQVCPKKCIDMKCDTEGFWYPLVDENNCIGCGLCEKVCPINNPFECRETKKIYAAFYNNNEARKKSSSGGVFSLLAQQIIQKKGVVFGAKFDNQWQVIIDCGESSDDVERFLGSKYVQAKTGVSFKKCESFLKQGRLVLYAGTPCQIAGLKHFLRREYDNLITVDLVCHGVPSPMVWERYLKETIAPLDSIKEINFRDKRNGWHNFCLTITYNVAGEERLYEQSHKKDLYMQAFLQNLILRPSCYNCSAKNGASCSDITLADYWGVEKKFPEIDDNKGVSLIFFNTGKGLDILNHTDLKSKEVVIYDVLPYNPGLKQNALCHAKREKFFKKMWGAKNLESLLRQSLKRSLFIKARNFLKKVVSF